jgi:predicted transglutaminase-like cysteine proteinase
MFVRTQSDFAAMRPGLGANARGPDDFLASKRLAVSRTGFDKQWNRVRRGTLSASLTGIARGNPGEATIAAVNAWANARIRYVEDRELYGQADYWADARTTLRRRAGDCEDIAIAKMALLAGAGVRREDMYLTIAHDLVRNADHALLVVKSGGRYWLLDNNIDRLLDASEANDYRPILSYSSTGKWLHGY